MVSLPFAVDILSLSLPYMYYSYLVTRWTTYTLLDNMKCQINLTATITFNCDTVIRSILQSQTDDIDWFLISENDTKYTV